MKRAAKLTHHASYHYNINRTMRYKIEFFWDKLKPDLGIKWEMPIAHLIPQTPFATTIGDSLLEGAGGFSITLGFWWHIHFLDEMVQHTLRFKTRNNNSMLVLINVLELVMVIINYCTTLHVVWTSPITDDPHPVSSMSPTILPLYLGHSTCASNQKLGKCLLVYSVHC
jgi:hypothetical protein